MESPMYAKEASRELTDMPIVDIEKGDAEGSPAMNYDTAKGSHDHPHSPMNKQGYNDRLDESLVKDGEESSKDQSMKDRRDESKAMENFNGEGAYSSDSKMN